MYFANRVLRYVLIILIYLLTTHLYSQSTGYLEIGLDYYKKADFKNAATYFEKHLSKQSNYNTDLSECYYWYAQSLYHDSIANFERCLKYLDFAIEFNKKYKEAYFLRGRIKALELEIVDYISDFEAVRKFCKSNSDKDIYYKILSTYYIDGAKKAFLELQRIDKVLGDFARKPSLGELNYAYATLNAFLGNNGIAIGKLKIALNYGFNNFDFIVFDLSDLNDDDQYISLMEEFGVPLKFYKTMENHKRIIKENIRIYVEIKINNWQKKGKFEKTAEFQKRVTEKNRQNRIEYYTQAAIDSLGRAKLNWNSVIRDYDADNESFLIQFPEFNPIYVEVPLSDAPSFDTYFIDLEFNNFGFLLTDEYNIEIGYVEITAPSLSKSYIFDIRESIPFNSDQIVFNFEPIDLKINQTHQYNVNNKTTKVINVGISDVDENIPSIDRKREKTIALIIGNEDYSKYQTGLNSESDVDFAIRDAEIFTEYAIKTLGIPTDNITLLIDATSAQMQREIEKVSELTFAYAGEANVLFYYAGHGFPDPESMESYLMPVDVSGADVKHGVKLNYLYEKLTKYPSKKVVVLLDACFSGGGRNEGLIAARGVRVKPKKNIIAGNLFVLTSSTGDQSSLPYSNKKHGMFTYFLLKKLKETKGDITLEQLSEYISREVQINSLKINSKKQNPSKMISPDVENIWMDWTLN